MPNQLRNPASSQMQRDENKIRSEATRACADVLKKFIVCKTLSTPELRREIFDPAMRWFAVICSIVGASPKDEFLKLANEITVSVKEGTRYNFGNLRDFNREDLQCMEELITSVRTDKEKFPAIGKNEMKQALAMMATRDIYVPGFFIDGKACQFGNWARIRKQKPMVDGDCFDNVLNISVPIVPGKDIKVELRASGQEWMEHKLSMQEAYDFNGKICTFPESHPLFSGTQLATYEKGVYTFVARYAGKSTARIGDEEYRALNGRVMENIPKKALSQLMKIASKMMVLGELMQIHPMVAAFEYLREKSTGEGVDFENCEDLGFLVDRLLNEKSYPGDCKSISTMSAGLATCIGYAARRISGEVISLEGNEISGEGGHTWTEILHPEKNIWMPFDPAMGAQLAFPKDTVYILHDEIPKSLAPLEMRVSHE